MFSVCSFISYKTHQNILLQEPTCLLQQPLLPFPMENTVCNVEHMQKKNHNLKEP